MSFQAEQVEQAYRKAERVLQITGFKDKDYLRDREKLVQIFLKYPETTVQDVLFESVKPQKDKPNPIVNGIGLIVLLWLIYMFMVSV